MLKTDIEIEIISFGKIAEFITPQRLILEKINDTDSLKSHLEQIFPKLRGMKYKLALNKTVLQYNEQLNQNDSVAVMPPFSGG